MAKNDSLSFYLLSAVLPLIGFTFFAIFSYECVINISPGSVWIPKDYWLANMAIGSAIFSGVCIIIEFGVVSDFLIWLKDSNGS